MSIRHILTGAELQQLSHTDQAYLKRQLSHHTLLNRILNKPVNQRILHELQCILDKQPLPRQETGRFIRGQVSRLTDGMRYPIMVRKMTTNEVAKYGIGGN